jgi:hypothetical protein
MLSEISESGAKRRAIRADLGSIRIGLLLSVVLLLFVWAVWVSSEPHRVAQNARRRIKIGSSIPEVFAIATTNPLFVRGVITPREGAREESWPTYFDTGIFYFKRKDQLSYRYFPSGQALAEYMDKMVRERGAGACIIFLFQGKALLSDFAVWFDQDGKVVSVSDVKSRPQFRLGPDLR